MPTASLNESLSADRSIPEVPYDVAQRNMSLRSERSVPHVETPPEHRLMIALVRDAMRCIERYRHARDLRGKRLFALESEWILSDETDGLYCFARVCETLDLDPDAVRRSLGFGLPSTSGRALPSAANVTSTLH
jgi:hypothetical protein